MVRTQCDDQPRIDTMNRIAVAVEAQLVKYMGDDSDEEWSHFVHVAERLAWEESKAGMITL